MKIHALDVAAKVLMNGKNVFILWCMSVPTDSLQHYCP